MTTKGHEGHEGMRENTQRLLAPLVSFAPFVVKDFDLGISAP
jgi:hypothetical protein